MDKKIEFVVVNENILGYVDPRTPAEVGVLSSSVIRGAVHLPVDGPLPLPTERVRPAALCDFDDFRVSIKGYDSDPRYNMPVK